jgi:hypothetical protein
MNKDHDTMTNQRFCSNGNNDDDLKYHSHANEEDHGNIGKDDSANNPWSLLGISENDIDSVLNADDLGPKSKNDAYESSKKKNQGATKRINAKRQRESPAANSTNTTSKKVKGTEMSIRNVSKVSSRTTSTAKYKSNRKLPMTTTNTSRAMLNVPISTTLPKQEQPPSAQKQRRRNSLLSVHSEDHDADALRSITSSTSFLNHNSDMTNHNANAHDRTNIVSTTNAPLGNQFMAQKPTSGIAAETIVSSSSFTSNHEIHIRNSILNNNPMNHVYGPLHHRVPPTISSLTPHHHPQQHQQQQYIHGHHHTSNNSPPREYYPMQQRQPQYLNHRRPPNHLTSELLELQLQYQRSIQRITNSMMQSHRTKCILQRNGTNLLLRRRRSSLTVTSMGSSSSNGGPSHSNNIQYDNNDHHHPQRRKSSLQFSNKTIIIPNIGSMKYRTNHENLHPVAEGKEEDVPSDKDQNRRNAMDESEVDVQSTTLSDSSCIMSHTKYRRRSSTSTSMSTTKTGTNAKTLSSSSFLWNDHPLRQDAASSSSLLRQQNPQQVYPLPPPTRHPNPWMMLQPTTNVEATREMLYHVLHSSNHVQEFMNLS